MNTNEIKQIMAAALVLRARNRWAKSAMLYLELLSDNAAPSSVHSVALDGLQICIQHGGVTDEALAFYSDYSGQNPDDIGTRFCYALLLAELGHREAAVTQWTIVANSDEPGWKARALDCLDVSRASTP